MVRSVFIAPQPSPSSLVPSTTAADYIEIPIVNENVKPTSSSKESAIIRADGQPADTIRTGFDVAGPLNSEFMFGAFDLLIRSVVGAASWAQVGDGEATSISLTVVAATKTLTGTGAFTNASVGDWLRLENSGEVNDGIACRIATKTSNDEVVVDSVVDAGASELTDETSTAGYRIHYGTRAAGGTTKQQLTYGKRWTDVSETNRIECMLGMLVNSWTLRATPNAELTTSFEFLGRKIVPDFTGNFALNANGDIDAGGTTIDLATYLASGFTAAPDNKVYNSIRNAAIVLDKTLSTVMTNFEMTVSGNAAGEPVIGQQGNRFVNRGSLSASVNTEAMVEDVGLYQKFINDDLASASIYINDGANQAYIIDVPSVRINDGGTGIQDQNSSIRLPLQFGAGVDPVTGRAFTVTRLDPAATYS